MSKVKPVLSKTVRALIEVSITPQKDLGFDSIAERIYSYPEVKSCYLVSGGYDLLVVVEGESIHTVADFVAAKLSSMANVRQTATHFLLRKYKEEGQVFKHPKSVHRPNISRKGPIALFCNRCKLSEKLSMRISKQVDRVAPSGIRAFFDLVLGMKDVISLGVGEPDFVTPWHVRARAIESLEQGYTSYTSNKGMIELRRDIAAFLKKRHGIAYDPEEEILITVGVSEALDLVMRAVLNPGEKILVPEPCYVAYGPVVELAGGKPVFLKTSIENGFKVTPQQIDEAVRPGVRGILLGYPCNPTGTSYSKKELEAIARVVKKHDLLVISDELYDELTYDFEHTPMATLPQMRDRVIYLNGFSKSYAMTGFRIGYACGPADIVGAMTKIHQYTMLCASITGQMAAMEALKNSASDVLAMKKEYDRRRRFIVGALNDIGMTCHMPQGAFYAFPSIKVTGETSMDFARNLLLKQKVALVPGDAFGRSCAQHVRISYASSYDNLKEAIARIEKYLKMKG